MWFQEVKLLFLERIIMKNEVKSNRNTNSCSGDEGDPRNTETEISQTCNHSTLTPSLVSHNCLGKSLLIGKPTQDPSLDPLAISAVLSMRPQLFLSEVVPFPTEQHSRAPKAVEPSRHCQVLPYSLWSPLLNSPALGSTQMWRK